MQLPNVRSQRPGNLATRVRARLAARRARLSIGAARDALIDAETLIDAGRLDEAVDAIQAALLEILEFQCGADEARSGGIVPDLPEHTSETVVRVAALKPFEPFGPQLASSAG